jgi:site-specific DNA recombinase
MRTNRTTKQQQTAVIYARARGESLDEENQAIQVQLRACREWAEKNRYTVAKEYVDRGKSTFHILEKREALKELLNDTVNEQWSFNLVIVHGFDRLFRNVVELEAFRAILGREHVKLISVTDDMLWYYGRVAQGANSYPSRISVS